jgi:SAM-dependent methyltransferase
MNAGWSQGYVTDVSYIGNFFRELSPAWLNHVAIASGAHPRPLDKPFTHIDLGCGLGRTTSLLAASFPLGQFYGVDFNPAHVDSAQKMAAELELGNAHFLESAFEDLDKADLPDFDFITLHGIYSWISEETRKAITRFIFRKLKPGGIVYNSYNCLPGWASQAPIRRLMVEFGNAHHGDSASRALEAVKDANAMAALGVGYFKSNPAAAKEITETAKRAPNYLAHEYLNAAWTTFYSADVADEMAEAKLTYLGSATLHENHLEMLLPDEAIAHIKQQPTERLRQLTQDYLTGQRFRRDVFVRGHAHLSRADISGHLHNACFALVGAPEDMTENAAVPRGEIKFAAEATKKIRAILAKGPTRFHDLMKAMGATANARDLERIIMLMAAAGKIMPVGAPLERPAPEATPAKIRIESAVNRRLVELGSRTVSTQFLAAPACGASIPLEPLELMTLGLMLEGASDLTAALKTELARRAIRINNKDGQPITEDAEAGAKIAEIVGRFTAKTLPTLIRFGIVAAA